MKLPPELQDKKEYTGERLTLNFQDIETRAVLQLLADTSGQNMVISDSVAGNVTLRLQNVPWDQALDVVMRTKGLDMRRDGNVMFIAPAAEIAARERNSSPPASRFRNCRRCGPNICRSITRRQATSRP